MKQFIYPENPGTIPEGFTEVTKQYKVKVIKAVLGVFLFMLAYFGMLIGFSYLTYALYIIFKTENGHLFHLAGAIASAMLVLFTLKFLFKKPQVNDKIAVEITPENEPHLYQFIQQVAEDTKGPKPNKIFVNHDVNAFVYFNNNLLSLFFPKKKNLMIGLGLINGLTISEFKAVVAHEFGHFSQSSMQVGSYVYMANKIIHDMIFERDKWDDALATWRSIDIRLSFIAWGLMPLIWLVRQLLFLIYKLINMLHASLSREMEFHADKVAVSVSGSEGIVHALWKLEKAFVAWDKTMNFTGIASSQDIYTDNLFKHHANELVLDQEKSPQMTEGKENDHNGIPIIFENKDEYSSLSMYASHPSNKDREENAKNPFISAPLHDESPWKLFVNKEVLQKELTKRMYLKFMDLKEEKFLPEYSKMEAFIAEERATEIIFGKEFLGSFNERYINIPDTSILRKAVSLDQKAIQEQYQKLIAEELPVLMKPIQYIDEKYQELQQIAQGVKKARYIDYKGTKYKKKRFQAAADRMSNDREEAMKHPFKEWDSEILSLSVLVSEQKEQQLMRIQMLDHLQENLRKINQEYRLAMMEVEQLMQYDRVDEDEIRKLRSTINDLIRLLNKVTQDNDTMVFTELPNIKTREELLQLLTKYEFKSLNHNNAFNNGEFNTIVQEADILIHKYNRLIFKLIYIIIEPIIALNKQ